MNLKEFRFLSPNIVTTPYKLQVFTAQIRNRHIQTFSILWSPNVFLDTHLLKKVFQHLVFQECIKKLLFIRTRSFWSMYDSRFLKFFPKTAICSDILEVLKMPQKFESSTKNVIDILWRPQMKSKIHANLSQRTQIQIGHWNFYYP